MSVVTNTVFPMRVIKCIEPRCDVGWNNEYYVCQGGQLITWKQETAQTKSTSILSWTPTTPSRAVMVMKVFYMDLVCNIQMAQTGGLTDAIFNSDAGVNGNVGLRAYPFQSMCASSTLTIGGTGVSQLQINAILGPLNEYVTCVGDLLNFETQCPTMIDQYQTYPLVANRPFTPSRNQFALYKNTANGGWLESRNINNYLYAKNATPITGGASTPLQVAFSEPVLFLSPLVNGMRQGPGASLYGINTFSLSFTVAAPHRMLCSGILALEGAPPTDAAYTGTFVGFNGNPDPVLEVCYITPQPNAVPPVPHGSGDALNWNYLNYDFQESAVKSVASQVNTEFTCNSYTAKSVPKYLCIFARRQYSEFDSNGYVDAYGQITRLNISWNNNNQRLGEMSPYALYQLSNKNKTSASWPRFRGAGDNILGADVLNGSGSSILIDVAQDLGMTEDLAPGVVGNYQLTISGYATNLSAFAMNMTLGYIVVYSGIFQYSKLDGTYYSQVGVLSDQLINPALEVAPHGTHASLTSFSGGGFFDKFKSILDHAGVKLPSREHVMSRVQPYLPPVLAQRMSRRAGSRRRSHRSRGGRKGRRGVRFGGASGESSDSDAYHGGAVMNRNDLLTSGDEY